MQESTWRRAQKDSKIWLLGHIIAWFFAYILPGGGTVLATWLIPSPNTISWENALLGFLGGFVGLLLFVVVVYVWNLFRAPYRQRDEAWGSNQKLKDKLEDKKSKRQIKNELATQIILGTEVRNGFMGVVSFQDCWPKDEYKKWVGAVVDILQNNKMNDEYALWVKDMNIGSQAFFQLDDYKETVDKGLNRLEEFIKSLHD